MKIVLNLVPKTEKNIIPFLALFRHPSLESYKKDVNFYNIEVRDKIDLKNNDLKNLFKLYDFYLVVAWNKNRERITYFYEYFDSLKNPYTSESDSNQKINNVENSIKGSDLINSMLFNKLDSLLKKVDFKIDLVNGVKIIEVN